MKKPQSAQKRQASQKKAEKRNKREREMKATKHIRNKEKKNLIASQQRKFNEYMSNLLSSPDSNQFPQ